MATAENRVRTQRFRRLEEFLSALVDDNLTDDHFQRLVDFGVTEGDDLDFKAAPYDKTDKGKSELAKDVSAFANHVGGVIIIGVADTKGVASKCTPVGEADDAEIRRMRSLMAARIHPLPRTEIIRCRSAANVSLGYLLILVPRSPLAPHAVSDASDTALRYFTRYGSQTLPMAETLVSARYRDRFEQARGRMGRLDELMAEGISRLDRHVPCIATGAVPEVAGALALDASSSRKLRQWARRLPALRLGALPFLDTDVISIGPRRMYLGDSEGAPVVGPPVMGARVGIRWSIERSIRRA